MSEDMQEAGRSALFEVCVVTVLSLVPLILIAYYQYVVQDAGFNGVHPNPHHLSLWDFVYNNTAAGQLAFYAIANWACVAWICGLERKVHIPARPLYILLCIVGFTYCGILIAITAATNYTPTSSVTIPASVIYLASIICYLLLLIYEKLKPPSAESSNIAGARDLHRRVNALRGGE
jgi:hypothetical protein